jgi:hypothetical protein
VSHGPAAAGSEVLRVPRRAALVGISILVGAASLVSFAESYRGLYLWAAHHGLHGAWAHLLDAGSHAGRPGNPFRTSIRPYRPRHVCLRDGVLITRYADKNAASARAYPAEVITELLEHLKPGDPQSGAVQSERWRGLYGCGACYCRAPPATTRVWPLTQAARSESPEFQRVHAANLGRAEFPGDCLAVTNLPSPFPTRRRAGDQRG